jgi:hypothetical protein
VSLRARLLAGSLLASSGVLLFGAPAQAVQTQTWGITAAAGSTGLAHSADGSTVHEAVLVYNRTAAPLTVNLYVLATNHRNGVYQFSKPTTGLAADTKLGTSSVHLGPHQQVQVPVTVHLPRHIKTAMLAGIGAEAAPINHGELSIREQLVVLVKATPTSHSVPIQLSAPNVAGWGAAAAVLLSVVVAFMARQKRRSTRVPALAT